MIRPNFNVLQNKGKDYMTEQYITKIMIDNLKKIPDPKNHISKPFYHTDSSKKDVKIAEMVAKKLLSRYGYKLSIISTNSFPIQYITFHFCKN